MPAKRKAAGKAGKGKSKKAKTAVRKHVPAASYLQPYRDLPSELLIKIFRGIEDPITATSFGLATHRFEAIFKLFRKKVFPDTVFPLKKLPLIIRFGDKSQISLRATLHSWFPADFFSSISLGKYIHNEYAQQVLEDMIDNAEENRNERKNEIYERREAKEIRQEERAERKAEKAIERESMLEGWRQAMWASIEDGYESLDLDNEPTDYASTDEDSESGEDMDLDSDGDQALVRPNWEALGIPEPDWEEWVQMSKDNGKPEKSKKKRARSQK